MNKFFAAMYLLYLLGLGVFGPSPKHYSFLLDGAFDMQYLFRPEMIGDILLAEPDSKVTFILKDNPGGYVIVLNTLTSYIERSKANITILVRGHTASAAAVFQHHSNQFIMPYKAKTMYHTPSIFGIKLTEYNKDENPLFKSIYDDFLVTLSKIKIKDILTEDEYNRMLKGDDIWIEGTDFCTNKERKMKIIKLLKDKCIVEGIRGYRP